MFLRVLPAVTALGLVLSLLSLTAGTVQATGVPGLASAALMPGWTTPEGTRMTAIDLQLEPGWKTYWRSPGDAGIPPSFDWGGSDNLGRAQYHWPAPEIIDSGGTRTLGFHDRLLLPVEITPQTPGQPVDLAVTIDFGLCREVCVPAHVRLTAPAAGLRPDPQIEAALAAVPVPVQVAARCEAQPIADGMRVTATIPALALPPGDGAPRVAMELATLPADGTDAGAAASREADGPAPSPSDSEVWVSQPKVFRTAAGLSVAADFVPPTGKPFDLDPRAVRLTLIGEAGAVEIQGCTTLGPAPALPGG